MDGKESPWRLPMRRSSRYVQDGNYFSVADCMGKIRQGMIQWTTVIHRFPFGTFENITREDMVTIMYRYAKPKKALICPVRVVWRCVFLIRTRFRDMREALAWAAGKWINQWPQAEPGLVDPLGKRLPSGVRCHYPAVHEEKYMSTH